MHFAKVLEKLINQVDLSPSEMEKIMDDLMQGNLTAAQIAALLTALRMKGESIDEITAAARTMRNHSVTIEVDSNSLVDTCGTGGDGLNTFNISTAAAFIAAGAGVRIAKHGNRSVSSKCGSADVLVELGVNIETEPEKVRDCIQSIGIGFLFAPKHHPAMKHAVIPRKELGIRTLFNMVGPLTNPANAKFQVLGVFAPELTEKFAAVLQRLGSQRAMVVHGMDHLDEITVTGETQITELKDNVLKTYTFDPIPHIGKYYRINQIKGGGAKRNAEIIRDILSGHEGPCSDIALLNGAAAIYISEIATDFHEAVDKAKASIKSGRASSKLNELIKFSNIRP